MTDLRRRWLIGIVAAVVALALPALALAHLERPSYWPDPSRDKSVSPPAGGEVPTARSLGSAVTGAGPGEVRVVCSGNDGSRSLQLLRDSVGKAEHKGYRLRPSQPREKLSEKQGEKLLEINKELAERCKYDEIQAAVNASGNNDRVVIMPGRYKEPTARKQPKNDPECASLTQESNSGALTPSYRYQVTCPNDQNLIYVQGRAVPDEPPPSPPLPDRHGIPDEGKCVTCNFQLEGSGVKPVDVIIDGGLDYSGDGPEARPAGYAKDVVLRVDRADGFVGRNFLARGALEHGVYIEETDGYLLDKVKFFWAADYGNLTFTSDHGLYKNCDGFGAGDAVLYPGGAPDTGEQVDKSFYPDGPRINTTVKKCDMRGSLLGYSGSMGNAVRITKNYIYGNATGISSDTISSSGHPGFPADSSQIDHNYIFSNNLNLYVDNPPVVPLFGVPIGAGVIWPGMNNGDLHDNWIFDNWRYGSLLLAIPDFAVTPEGNVGAGLSCPAAQSGYSTSCTNRFHDNSMGRRPPDFEFPSALGRFDVPHGDLKDKSMPNGTDFWWDESQGSVNNCWFDNTGSDSTAASVTGPGAGEPPDDELPSACENPGGPGDAVKFGMLIDCSQWERGQTGADRPACEWFQMPPEPGTAQARAAAREFARVARSYAKSAEAERLRDGFEWAQARPSAGYAGYAGDAAPVGEVRVGTVAPLVQCRDWVTADEEERLATIADIRRQVNTGDLEHENAVLTDERAASVFDGACANDFAAGFRLYKLYYRAAAFQPLMDEAGR